MKKALRQDLTPINPINHVRGMTCPLCGTRKAKRSCPALDKLICTVCCGTKRQVEITCPEDCGYLVEARAHPPASARRQREKDFDFAVPIVHELSDTAYRLALMFQETIRRYAPAALPPLADSDVAEACGTLASTLETAAKGIIYEHQAQSLPAQRLVVELRSVLGSLGRGPSSSLEREAATALRRMELAAKTAASRLEGGQKSYLEFLGRMPVRTGDYSDEAGTPAAERAEGLSPGDAAPRPRGGSGLIIPG